MSDWPDQQSQPGADNDGDLLDVGEPITALADFDSDASIRLLTLIRRTIHRRTMTVQLLSFSWTAPGLVLKEFWHMLSEPTNQRNSGKEERP